MRRGRKEFLIVLPHPPEPDGPPIDRATFRLLTWLGGETGVTCVAEAPPLSQRLLRAGLERRGVRLLDGERPDSGAFYGRIQAAVRGRRYDAVVLVGPGIVSRWARPLRLLIPRQVMFFFFPDAGALTDPVERFSSSARQGVKARWRPILSLADGIWTRGPQEAARLERCFRIDPSRLDALPGSWDAGVRRWVSSALARRSRVRIRPPRSVRLAAVGLDAPDAARLRDALSGVTGGRPRCAAIRDGDGAVRELNRFLAAGSWTYALVCLHPMAPSRNLIKTLLEGMHLLPYAGAAVPLDFDAVRRGLSGPLPLKDGLFAAAWAMKNKGSWHEVDYVSHCCCLVVRREAWEECGKLDERFRRVEPAWADCFLRMQLGGRPVLLAQDALAGCRQSPKRSLLGGGRGRDGQDEDRDLLIEKWCKGSLRLMESLLTSLEPEGYRELAKKDESRR